MTVDIDCLLFDLLFVSASHFLPEPKGVIANLLSYFADSSYAK